MDYSYAAELSLLQHLGQCAKAVNRGLQVAVFGAQPQPYIAQI